MKEKINLNTFGKIHKFLCNQKEISQITRINIMAYIAKEFLE